MQRTRVASSNIESIGYDPQAEILEIEFTSGAIYKYFNVPQRIYQAFVSAGSHGEFLNNRIKNSYRYQRVR